MKLFTHIIEPHCTTGSQTMINDATPDIARTPHTFIKRIGCPGQRVGCAIYAEEAVANAMMERLSNALHLKTATVAMSYLTIDVSTNYSITKKKWILQPSFFLSVGQDG